MTMTQLTSSTALAGRLLMASVFAPAGYSKVLAASATAQYMGSAGLPASPTLSLLVGLFEITAALLLLLGLKARWAAWALAIFTLLASVLFHAFWSVPADQQFVQQLLFAKNIGLAGGLLFLAAMGSGPWSLDAALQARATAAHRHARS
jgi:putative oxidoreductase